ncbi:MAG: succinate dehydrogenase cytochrome b subunit [Bacteroidales bacterium]
MGNFFCSSVGKKFVMGISGAFLAIFILVHLVLNSLALFDDSGDLYNMGAHFMATNPLIKVMEPILALGFVVHIVYSFILSYQNWKARPVKYAMSKIKGSSTWASRNMLILGLLVLVFIGMHLMHFFAKIKLGIGGHPETVTVMQAGVPVEMENVYAMIKELFSGTCGLVYGGLYVLGGILLGLHLTHGFWSAFQSMGLNNKVWKNRWMCISKIYAWVIAVGYCMIPIYFLIKF